MSSSKILKNLYKIEGLSNFEKVVLQQFDTREEANAYEDKLISTAFQNEPDNIYNLRRSGIGKHTKNSFNRRVDLWVDYYEAIRTEYQSGVSVSSLASRYCCDKTTLYKILGTLLDAKRYRSKAWEHEEEIVQQYLQGFSRKSLAEKYKCDMYTLKSILIKHSIELKSYSEQYLIDRQRGIEKKTTEKVLDLEKFKELYYDKGYTLVQIAKFFNIHKNTISKLALKNNMILKPIGYHSKVKKHPAWNYVEEIQKYAQTTTKAYLLEKYGIKDRLTLNRILKAK